MFLRDCAKEEAYKAGEKVLKASKKLIFLEKKSYEEDINDSIQTTEELPNEQ
jgi:hypothetical protein